MSVSGRLSTAFHGDPESFDVRQQDLDKQPTGNQRVFHRIHLLL
jgi:hypothetical protein